MLGTLSEPRLARVPRTSPMEPVAALVVWHRHPRACRAIRKDRPDAMNVRAFAGVPESPQPTGDVVVAITGRRVPRPIGLDVHAPRDSGSNSESHIENPATRRPRKACRATNPL